MAMMAAGPESPEGGASARALRVALDYITVEIESTTTVTLFANDRPGGSSQLCSALRRRLAAVISLNPWLAGKLVRTPEGPTDAALEWNPSIGDDLGAAVLRIYREAPLELGGDRETPLRYALLGRQLEAAGAKVPRGAQQLGGAGQQSIALLSVLTCDPPKADEGSASGTTTAAVVFSLSHAVADGHTYYKLLGMLSDECEPCAMKPVAADPSVLARVLGSEAQAYYYSKLTWLNFLISALLRKTPACRAFYIDSSKVEMAKAAAVAGSGGAVSYVSTNDVLVSEVARMLRPRVVFVALNLRGRATLDSGPLEGNDAGNHLAIVTLGRGDVATPALVRQAIAPASKDGPYVRVPGDEPLPGLAAHSLCRCLMVTNWAFRSPLQVDGVGATLHLPTYVSHGHPSDLAVIFQPTPKEQRAVLLFTRALDGPGLEAAAALPGSVLGGPVAPHLVSFAPAAGGACGCLPWWCRPGPG